jgi:hypothetical protein
MDFNELCFVGCISRNKPGRFRVFAIHRFKLQFFSAAALNHVLFRRHRARPNGIKEKLRAFTRRGHVIGNRELMCFRGLQLVQSKLIGRARRQSKHSSQSAQKQRNRAFLHSSSVSSKGFCISTAAGHRREVA